MSYIYAVATALTRLSEVAAVITMPLCRFRSKFELFVRGKSEHLVGLF